MELNGEKGRTLNKRGDNTWNHRLTLHQPWEETPVINQWLPLGGIPLHVLEIALLCTRMATEQNDNRVCLGRDESEDKDIATGTVVALQNCLSKRSISVKCDFFIFGSYKMIHNVTTADIHEIHKI